MMVPGWGAIVIDKGEIGEGAGSEEVISHFGGVRNVGVPGQGVEVEVTLDEG